MKLGVYLLLISTIRTTLTDNRQCVCVPYFDCANNYSLKGLVSVYHELRAYDENGPRPSCDSATDVCCNLSSNNSNTDVYFAETSIESPAIANSSTASIEEWSCGYRGDKAGKASAFGENASADYGEYPWQVAVMGKTKLYGDSVALNYHCGGSLINERAALTSAHEVYKYKPGQLVVRVGQYDWNSKSEPHQDINVKSVHIHPGFEPESYVNNYALLILAKPVKPNANINSICLAVSSDDYETSACIETGWGEDRRAVQQNGTVLKKSELVIITRRDCENVFRIAYDNENYRLASSIICAGDDKLRNPCTGNGGSPIVCPLKTDPRRYVQVGIASTALCRKRYRPGLYADVANGQKWISQTINSEGLSSNSYLAQ